MLEQPDKDRPQMLADGIYWLGFADVHYGAYCNPYLVVEGEEAVVIDGGSRPDFPAVMMKILQTGLPPSAIRALIYQHYDPDVCGSIPHFTAIINRPDLQVVTTEVNSIFIHHYGVTVPFITVESLGHRFLFRSGRTLRFIPTPYAHAAGSFMTFDESSGVLFTSDLFGSFAGDWSLFLKLGPICHACPTEGTDTCAVGHTVCPMAEILRFHSQIFPCNKALRHALDCIRKIPYRIIAPQHGYILTNTDEIRLIAERLMALSDVGIDGLLQDPRTP